MLVTLSGITTSDTLTQFLKELLPKMDIPSAILMILIIAL